MSDFERRSRASTGHVWDAWVGRWRIVSVVGVIVLTSLSVMSGDVEQGSVPLVLLGAGALVVWLAIPPSLRGRLGLDAGWKGYSVVTPIWVLLAFVDVRFIWLGAIVYAEYCVISTAWMWAAASTIVGTFIARSAVVTATVDWLAVLVLAFLVGFGLVMVHYVADIARQSRQRQELIDELEKTRAKLAGTEREAGILEERHRISREIHDTLAQGFTSIVMLLETAEASLSTNPPVVEQSIASSLSIARDSLSEARRLVWELRPEAVTTDGLVGALHRLADRTSEAHGTKVTLSAPDDFLFTRPELDTVFFRIAQEGLANVVKHSGAQAARIELSHEDHEVSLSITDDGTGFDPTAPVASPSLPPRLGLRYMQERVEMLGGSFRLTSSPGDGTSIVAIIPERDSLVPENGVAM